MGLVEDLDIRPSDILRFWEKVNFKSNSCWEWTGSIKITGNGNLEYSNFNLNRGKIGTIKGHRLSYLLYHNPNSFDDMKLIRHLCSNSKCVNPRHLATGTHYDNYMDMVASGKDRYGENCPLAKFTNEQVKEIRGKWLNGEKESDLVKQYKLNPSSMWELLSNVSYYDPNYIPKQRRKLNYLPITQEDIDIIKSYKEQGISLSQIARNMNVGNDRIFRINELYILGDKKLPNQPAT